MKLEVGKSYRTREGCVRTITAKSIGSGHTYIDEGGRDYNEAGLFVSAIYPSNLDLIEEIVEEVVEEQPNDKVGASKNNKKDCKPDYALLPKAFMDQVAFVLMAGEIKYGRFNYCLGHDITQITAAQGRHIKQIEAGEDIDWDTTNRLRDVYPEAPEITHAACVAAGSLMMLHQRELGTLRDDRYKKGE